MHFIAIFVLPFLLAGQAALALNVTIGSVDNISANDFVTVQDSSLTSQCQSVCGPASSTIQACNNDDGCLCSNATVTAVTACQQCFFTTIIEDNRMMPELLAGSTPALAAYVAACQTSPANITVPVTEVALTLPPSWDGPAAVHLNLGETILYVMTGAIIGVGSLGIICTM
ncbi:hypothetical protein F5888DRAFT_1714093 [Russula emetica]|nr:hypothetical protein F5888DRAFT_1714093 [Russula emetica]